MPLVVLCGIPASGKSAVCAELVAREEASHEWREVVVVPDGQYGSAEEEKITRARIFSAVERALAADVLVIVDALNYVKVLVGLPALSECSQP